MTVKVYCGCKMTGLMCDDMIDNAQRLSITLVENGITPYHPVLKENIPYMHEPLNERSPEEMHEIWEADKAAIKDAHVVIDTAPHIFSAGIKEEITKARYRDWKPTVAIYPEGTLFVPFIVNESRDFVTTDENTAAMYIQYKWGSRWKRMKWRFPIYMRHIADLSIRKLAQFWY